MGHGDRLIVPFSKKFDYRGTMPVPFSRQKQVHCIWNKMDGTRKRPLVQVWWLDDDGQFCCFVDGVGDISGFFGIADDMDRNAGVCQFFF